MTEIRKYPGLWVDPDVDRRNTDEVLRGDRRVIEGQWELDRLYRTEEDPDLDFNGAVEDPEVVDDAWASWRREVRHAEEAYAEVAFDQLCQHHDGELEVREILVHLVEEYARHCGHADLLREAIDGRTGQ